MKKLRINVNNKIYDVVVQVLEDDEAQVTGAGYLDPLPLPPQATRPAPPAGVAVPAPAPAGAPARGDANAIA